MNTIGLDVDGVLRDFSEGFRISFLKRFPNKRIKLPICSYKLEDSFNLSASEVQEFYNENANEIFYKNSPAIDDALKGVNYLRRLGYNINIVTAQNDNTLEPTIKWLKKHKIKFDKMFCTEEKQNAEFDILIDDKPKHIIETLQANKKAILFLGDNVLNKEHKNLLCVKNWNEIIDVFENLSKVELFIKNSTSFPS